MTDNETFIVQSDSPDRLYVKTYHDFLDSTIINGKEKLIFILLKRYLNFKDDESGIEGTVYPTLETLSKQAGMTKKTVIGILKKLESKGLIVVKQQGLNKPNIYTLYDYSEIWKAGSSAEIEDIKKNRLVNLREVPTDVLLNELKRRNKTKELETEPTKAQNQALKYNNDMLNTTIIPSESQAEESWIKECIEEERWSEEDIKQHYEYDILISRHQDIEDIDGYIELLYDLLNEKGEYITISGDKKPVKKVWEKLEKLNYEHILYCIEQMSKQTTRINNAKEYKKKLLYEAYYQMHDDIKNQVQHDMANWEPQTE